MVNLYELYLDLLNLVNHNSGNLKQFLDQIKNKFNLNDFVPESIA